MDDELGGRETRWSIFTIVVMIEDKEVISVDLWRQIKSTKNGIDDALNNGAE